LYSIAATLVQEADHMFFLTCHIFPVLRLTSSEARKANRSDGR
jgi:hypothetical protein